MAKPEDTLTEQQKQQQSAAQELANKIVNIAREKYVGKFHYKMGVAEDSSDAVDCGTLVKRIFSDAGIDLGTRMADHMAIMCRNTGDLYDASDEVPEPGDLVFYKNTYVGETEENIGVTHVGLCTGNGMEIDASSSANSVVERQIMTNYARMFGRLKELKSPLAKNATKIAPGVHSTSTGARSSDGGFRIIPIGGDMVRIIKLPEGKTFCEPIYPDLVTVEDTVPEWVLKNTLEHKGRVEEEERKKKELKNSNG